MDNQSAVLDLVRRWAAAELAGDVEAYPSLLAPDFIGIGPVGFVLDADQWVQRHRGGNLKNRAFEVSDAHIRFYEDTAIIEAVERQETTAMGRDTSGSFRLGIVAVKSAGTWRLAHIQFSGPLIAPEEMPSFAR